MRIGILTGGGDTLSYRAHLHNQGFKVIAIPKTMDVDVPVTDYTIGFSTCVSGSNSKTKFCDYSKQIIQTVHS